MNWVRTRITNALTDFGGRKVRFLLGERSDGGVFFITMKDAFPEEAARMQLDEFLTAPLNPRSVGKFDVDPTIYIPGMSPGVFK